MPLTEETVLCPMRALQLEALAVLVLSWGGDWAEKV